MFQSFVKKINKREKWKKIYCICQFMLKQLVEMRYMRYICVPKQNAYKKLYDSVTRLARKNHMDSILILISVCNTCSHIIRAYSVSSKNNSAVYIHTCNYSSRSVTASIQNMPAHEFTSISRCISKWSKDIV